MAAVSALDHLARPTHSDPWQARSGWRQARLYQPAAWTHAGREHAARVSAVVGDEAEVIVDVGGHPLHVRLAAGGRLSVEGETIKVWDDGELRVAERQGRAYRFERGRAARVDDHAAGRRAWGDGGEVSSPMPGRVVRLAVQAGDRVTPNQPLLVLEAMKMEHVVEAPHAAVVTGVHVQPGEQVSAGALLVTLTDEKALE
jgi:3-methylcrotonyl-CoA carboxylase alpha subunit